MNSLHVIEISDTAANIIGNAGGFLFSVSFGYFVTWFGRYDLALIPVALLLTIGAFLRL